MSLDKIILLLVVVFAAIWAAVMVAGVMATLPYGLPILALFLLFGYIIYRIVRDRLNNKEDDYYEKNIDQ